MSNTESQTLTVTTNEGTHNFRGEDLNWTTRQLNLVVSDGEVEMAEYANGRWHNVFFVDEPEGT